MNNEGAKRLFKCFGSDPQYTQAVCENGTWTGANCLGLIFKIVYNSVGLGWVVLGWVD